MQRSRLLVAVVLVVAAGLVWALMRPDAAPTADGAALATVVQPASLSAAAIEGKAAFDAKCAACHGDSAAGRAGMGPPLIDPIYRPGHHADIAFVVAAKTGTRQHHWTFGNMPPVEGITDADLAAIIAYVRELQRANGIN